jgi:hypothetical protein
MELSSKARCPELVRMMDAFVAGKDRSRDLVGMMEAEFVAWGLEDNEQFRDLKFAIRMFGVGDREANEKRLAGECRYAVRLLREKP